MGEHKFKKPGEYKGDAWKKPLEGSKGFYHEHGSYGPNDIFRAKDGQFYKVLHTGAFVKIEKPTQKELEKAGWVPIKAPDASKVELTVQDQLEKVNEEAPKLPE